MQALLWLSAGLFVLGQGATDNEAELKDILYPFYGREAARYEFFLDEKREQRLDLQKQPVLTWTNAEKYMGAVFIWTYGGRPEVIGCIGSHQNKPDESNVFHEFHSLCLHPLATVKFGGGKQEWTPSRPGLELNTVDGAPSPSDSERARLTQMRNIAREFDGAMKDNNDVTELRLLTQPIVRYKAPERGVVDGAIFALVWKGTDPEILIVLEDRKVKSDETWQYALARFNFREMWVKRHDKEVWRVGVARENEIYITGQAGPAKLSEIRAAAPQSRKP
jgi:hypothetical protein